MRSGAARLLHATEEHGHGRQVLRFRIWQKPSRAGLIVAVGLGALTVGAYVSGNHAAGLLLGLLAASVAGATAYDCACATAALVSAAGRLDGSRAEGRFDVVPRHNAEIERIFGGDGVRVRGLSVAQAAPQPVERGGRRW